MFWQLPLGIVLGVGVLFALFNLRTCPRVMQLAAAGMGAMLLVMIVTPIVSSLIGLIDRENFRTMHALTSLWGFIASAVNAAGTAAVIAAVFLDRPGVWIGQGAPPGMRPSSTASGPFGRPHA